MVRAGWNGSQTSFDQTIQAKWWTSGRFSEHWSAGGFFILKAFQEAMQMEALQQNQQWNRGRDESFKKNTGTSHFTIIKICLDFGEPISRWGQPDW